MKSKLFYHSTYYTLYNIYIFYASFISIRVSSFLFVIFVSILPLRNHDFISFGLFIFAQKEQKKVGNKNNKKEQSNPQKSKHDRNTSNHFHTNLCSVHQLHQQRNIQ